MNVHAIVPARSGSRGVPDKNVREIDGKPLIGYSIEFARSLESVDHVICSTDSPRYAEVAKRYGAEVPFLRSGFAASDSAMEEDILIDLHDCYERVGMEKPDLLVWLRPTFLFRDRSLVQRCIDRLKASNDLTACRLVCSSESRLYRDRGGVLEPTFDDKGASMARRQDTEVGYRVYNADVFRFPQERSGVNRDFLGRSIGFEVADRACALDIDDEWDFRLVESIITKSHDLVRDFLPPEAGSDS